MKRSFLKSAAVLAVSALLLASCATETETPSGGEGGAGGEGLPADASKEEFIAAFEDIPEMKLTTQLSAAKGSHEGDYFEDWTNALDEWSGGKINIEIGYGNSIVPPDEANTALGDGRLTFGQAYPVYDPSRYPAYSTYADAAFKGKHSIIAGVLQSSAAFLESGYKLDEVMEETLPDGVKMLLPYGPQTSNGLFCTEPRATESEVNGARVRVATAGISLQAEEMGMSPVSLPYSEIYQALERGTIDCTIGQEYSIENLGVIPLAPNFTIDPEVGFARVPFTFGVNQATWDEMPLIAQQLIWDRMDVWIKGHIGVHIFGGSQIAYEQIDEEDGVIQPFAPEAVDKLEKANVKLDEKIAGATEFDGEEFLADIDETMSKWDKIVTEELGYSEATGDDLLEQLQPLGDGPYFGPDLDPYIERLSEEVLTPNRPS